MFLSTYTFRHPYPIVVFKKNTYILNLQQDWSVISRHWAAFRENTIMMTQGGLKVAMYFNIYNNEYLMAHGVVLLD